MKLDNLVTTYEQSKRIQELGFESGSIFVYSKLEVKFDPSRYVVGHAVYHRNQTGGGGLYEFYDIVGCLTAEELAEILPNHWTLGKEQSLLNVHKVKEIWRCAYIDHARGSRWETFEGPTLAQAMGDMLIYLLENNLLPTHETMES